MCGTMAEPTATQDSEPVVLTVGHSTRPIADFIALLKAHSVARLIDVRTVPRSRHNPQFDRDTLPAALAADGIGYRSEEHTSELQSHSDLVCRLLLEKKKTKKKKRKHNAHRN